MHIFDRIWRHGQVVRRGTANPLSPVQIWVPPDQQIGISYSVDLTQGILASQKQK